MNTKIDVIGELKGLAKYYNVSQVANELLDDPRFAICSGSCVNSIHSVDYRKHHYGDGGLAAHTYEVVKLCLDNAKTFHKHNIDETELFLAALFHDAGKMFDYKKVASQWIGSDHKRLIHHISRSGIIWSNAINKYTELSVKYHDNVLHAILAHHGQREFGSPVAPKTRVAWLVHLCDNLSARMSDADTFDVIKKG